MMRYISSCREERLTVIINHRVIFSISSILWNFPWERVPYLNALEVFHDEALYKYTFTFTFTFYLYYIHNYSPCIASPAWQSNQRGPAGLADQSMKKPILVFLNLSNSFLRRWDCNSNYLLVQHDHLLTTLLEKNTSNSPERTSFYLIIACDLLFPCYSYPV